MANVVFKKLAGNRSRTIPAGKTSVQTKRVRDEYGALVSIRTVDASSKTIAEDFTLVFGKNVRKAREDNKRVLGVADVEPAE